MYHGISRKDIDIPVTVRAYVLTMVPVSVSLLIKMATGSHTSQTTVA